MVLDGTSKGSFDLKKWYPERDLNPYTQWITDFKSVASADSAIRALDGKYNAFFDFFKVFSD